MDKIAFKLTEGHIDLTVHDARFSEVMGRVEGTLGRISRTMADITVAAGAMASGMAGAAVVAMKTYGSFERAMRRATAVSSATEMQFRKMSTMAEAQSIRLNIAAVGAADAFYYLGSAGLSVTEQMQAYVPVLTLAKAATIGAAEAAENMVDTIKGFRLAFSETGRVADVMTQAVISSNMNFTQLGQTLELVAGVAHIMNNSIEETVAVIAHMANVGIKASMAGTSLRRALLNLGAPTTKMSQELKKWNVEVYTVEGRMKPFIQILGELNEKLKYATEEQRNMTFRVIFGARAISGQIAVFQTGKKALDEYTQSLRNAGGVTERVAGKQLKAFLEQLGMVWRRIKMLTRHIGEMLAPGFLRLAKETSDTIDLVISKVDKYSLSVQEWGENVAVKINWLRRELFEVIKFLIYDWPAAWNVATTAMITSLNANISFVKSTFWVIVETFKAIGKAISEVFDKIWSEFENRAIVASKRAWEKSKYYHGALEEDFRYRAGLTPQATGSYPLNPLTMAMLKSRHPTAYAAAEEYARRATERAEREGFFERAAPTVPTRPWSEVGTRAGAGFAKVGGMMDEAMRTYLWDMKVALEATSAAIPDYLKDAHDTNLRRLNKDLLAIWIKYSKLRQKVVEDEAEIRKKSRFSLLEPGGGGRAMGGGGGIGFVGVTEAWANFAKALGESPLLLEQQRTTRAIVKLQNNVITELPVALANQLKFMGTAGA